MGKSNTKRKSLNSVLRRQVLERDFYCCRACGSPEKNLEIHHIKPVVYGGDDSIENLISLCSVCHNEAPDTKEELFKYIKMGGAATRFIMGEAVFYAEENGLDINMVVSATKSFFEIYKDMKRRANHADRLEQKASK